jgi:hypothetical protein
MSCPTSNDDAPDVEEEEMTMRYDRGLRPSALVVLAAVLALAGLIPASPARAQATVFNQNETISLASLYPLNVILPSPSLPCITEPIKLVGDVHIVHHITVTPQGVMYVVVHGNLQGVQGITPSGAIYRGSGAATETHVFTNPTPDINGEIGSFPLSVSGQLTGPGLGNGIAVSFTLIEHIFRTANGFVVAGLFAGPPQVGCQ